MVQATLKEIDPKTKTRRTKGLDRINIYPDNYKFVGLKDSLGYPASEGFLWAGFQHKDSHEPIYFKCPYGQVGDRLWVKETFKHYANKWDGTEWKSCITYKAGNVTLYDSWDKNEPPSEKWWNKSTILDRWQPSIFMPRWASRITLEITDIRVERLNSISYDDVIAEGVSKEMGLKFGFASPYPEDKYLLMLARHIYVALWDSINGKKHSWESNPFVWVIEFRRL